MNTTDENASNTAENTSTINDKLDKLFKVVNDMKSTQSKLITSFNAYRDEKKIHDKKFTDIEGKLDIITKHFNDLLNENKALKNQIEIISSKLVVLEARNSTPPSVNHEEILSEIIDRQARSRNLILFNVHENTTDSLNEIQVVSELFRQIGVTTVPLNVLRLGKISNNARPIRVTLPNQHDIFNVLKNKFKLRQSENLKHISISTDRSLGQRKYFKVVLDELNTRKAAGENDIFIKFNNNIPFISKKLPKLRPSSYNLKFYYQNIRGINTKLDVFNRNIALVDYDIIILTETWLHNEVNDIELGIIPKYTVFRCDRDSVMGCIIRGGGVLIAIKNHLQCNRIPLQNNNIEQLFIKLSMGSFTLLIGSVYIPPNSSVDIYNDHTDTVSNLLNLSHYSNVILLGDYNLPGIHWSLLNNKIVPNVSQFNNLIANNLANFSYLNLNQFNLVKNRSDSILDLVLSNAHNLVVRNEPFSLLPIDYMYHPALTVTLPTNIGLKFLINCA
ncbi:uncharacterized protein LOC112689501 [Sipha flava]|uniref:Uncharacterized protein LOC112689501 n=1 Tax=Sipha flava TaxID=143950 RepID=A0A8B8G8F9_9HEMI|nr:uncharacterized protein LOC112689501 [Sipha flava]